MTGERNEATVNETPLLDRIREAHDATIATLGEFGVNSAEWLQANEGYQKVVSELVGRHVVFSGRYETATPNPKTPYAMVRGFSDVVEDQEAVVSLAEVVRGSADPELTLDLINGQHEKGYTTVMRAGNLRVIEVPEAEQAA